MASCEVTSLAAADEGGTPVIGEEVGALKLEEDGDSAAARNLTVRMFENWKHNQKK